MTNLIFLGALVFLLLCNTLFLFYLIQKFTLYNTMLKGNSKSNTDNHEQAKKRPGRKLGSKNKPKEKEEV